MEERDVIIVLTGTALFNRMRSLVHTEFYRKLISETANFRLNVYNISDTFDLHKAGISVLHVRAVAGVEKKVVIYVPCRQYQANHMSYADAVRSQQPPKRPMLAVAPLGETPNIQGQGHMAHGQDQTSALPGQGQSNSSQMPGVQQLACKADLQGRGPLRPVGKARGEPLGIRRQGQPQTGPVPVKGREPHHQQQRTSRQRKARDVPAHHRGPAAEAGSPGCPEPALAVVRSFSLSVARRNFSL